MRQVWAMKFGGSDVFEVREAAPPSLGRGEVRVRVAAAGVGFADVMARMGLYPEAPRFPAVLGYEVAGVVEALGEGVEHRRVGERVAAIVHFGGYSDEVCVPEPQTFPIPETMTFAQAAAVPINYLTAWTMVAWLANTSPGDVVLVHAAAGGVGLSAAQIARSRGATIIGTASPSKHERLRAQGVQHCIDYTSVDFEPEVLRLTGGRGVDIALDAIGGRSFAKSYRVLAPMGRLFLYGVNTLVSGSTRISSVPALIKGLVQMPRFGAMQLIEDSRGVIGVDLNCLWKQPDRFARLGEAVAKLLHQDRLVPVVDRTFPLAEVGAAHAYLQERKNFGKVVLVP